ncbi:hypothetical protein FRC11_014545, partial [Ceratobasidium sp. 423]
SRCLRAQYLPKPKHPPEQTQSHPTWKPNSIQIHQSTGPTRTTSCSILRAEAKAQP